MVGIPVLVIIIPLRITTVGRDIFVLGATAFDRDFVQRYTKLAAELLGEYHTDRDFTNDSHNESEKSESELSELSELSNSDRECRGTASSAIMETYSNMPNSHSTSTQTSSTWWVVVAIDGCSHHYYLHFFKPLSLPTLLRGHRHTFG